MNKHEMTRREFVKGLAATAALGGASAAAADGKSRLHVACNQFCWMNMYRRQKKDFNADLDAGLAEVKRSGMDGLEAMLGSPEVAERMIPLLKKHGLEMRSFYTGATLHDSAEVEKSIDRVSATAAAARKQIGTRIVVVNPTPLRPRNKAHKTDGQLATQAAAMTRLGRRLADEGLTLSYHFHDPAWQNKGREFHHVMTETDPKLVTLCLDAHWVFRGSGDDANVVFDVVKRYGRRVSELHIRQSKGGVWTECVSDGDIDYRRMAQELKKINVKPHLVLEQAVERDTPNTMDALESHRRSRAYVEEVFANVL